MDHAFDDDEHKSDDINSDDDLVLHASVSGNLLEKKDTTLKKKPSNSQILEDVIESDKVVEKESKMKPKLKEKSKSKKKQRGEVLTPEAALDFMIKERQDFDFECAALRAENDKLREGLKKYSHLSPSKLNSKKPEPEIVEKVVIKRILDPNGKKYKQDAEQLSLENDRLKQQHMEMEALLEQQRQLAEEAQQHPISKRKSVTKEPENVPETNNSTSVPKSNTQPRAKSEGKKSKPDKKSKKNPKQEVIQKSLQPVSAANCSTFPLLLWQGGILWKIPYNGRGVPERRLVMIKRAPLPGKKSKPVQLLNPNDGKKYNNTPSEGTYITNPPTIIWANPDKPKDVKNARELVLYEGAHIVLGHQSPAFWKSKSRGTPLPPEQFCFSIITNSRSLDLAAESIEEVVAWKNALHMLLVMMSPNQEWAIDNLVKKQPTWHYEELENHASQKNKKKKKDEIVTVGEPRRRDDDSDDGDADYRDATRRAKQSSLKDQMFAATRAADYDRLKNILQTQISVNLMEHGQDSDTILMIACRAGLDNIVKLCLDYGARNDPHPDFGQTALHCAVESRSYKCARVLLEVAAASQADSIIANLRDSGDQTPLHMSASFGDTKMSTILVSHGAEIDSMDSKRRAPLHLCAASGHKICLSLLLDNGGDMCIDMGDGQGNTPLHYSAEHGHLTCCRLLLETAANPIARNVHQQTPYNLASLRGHQKICLLLLDYQDSAGRGGLLSSTPPRGGPQRSTSLNALTSPFPQKIERHASVPTSSASPLFYKQQGHFEANSSSQGMNHALPRPHSARVNSSGSNSNGSAGGSPLSPMQYQYPNTARDRTHTSQSMMPDMASPMMNHPHSARDRTAPPLFDGLAVNSGYLNQQHPHQQQNSFPDQVQANLHNNHLFQHSKSIASMDSVPQSPVATPNRKGFCHRSPSPVAQSYDYNETTEVDYNAPSEEFELFDTVWHVYWTEDGYAYYLDTVTQHSQWEDPRTHGLLQYDEVTGELLTDASSSAIESTHDFHDYQANDEIKLALQQQDSFLQPKIPVTPKKELHPQTRPASKRVQSMKPQKIMANTADMSPYKTDNTSDDSNSDSDRNRFSVPARHARGSRTSQLKTNGMSKKMKAFGTPEKMSSSDDDSATNEEVIPRIATRMRDAPRQRQSDSDSVSGDDGGGEVGGEGSEWSSQASSDSDSPPTQRKQKNKDKSQRKFRASHSGEQGARQKDRQEPSDHEEKPPHPMLRKKPAPPGHRNMNIPLLPDQDVTDQQRRRGEVTERELRREGGSGTWFTAGGESGDSNDRDDYSDDKEDEDDDEKEEAENELDLSETVSRMVQPPVGMKPIKTNCFSPDKASLARAEHLQRKHSSTVSSPSRSCSSTSSGDDELNKTRRHKKGDLGLGAVQHIPDSEQVLEASMQLESDNDDDDDFFDTIITMKKDELASSIDNDVNNDQSDKSNASADYLKFLSKVEKESKAGDEDKPVSLAVDVDTSDWDEEMDEEHALKERASAEKEKQMRIFDTSQDGGYGNGGHTIPEELERKKGEDAAATTIESSVRRKSRDLHVDTEFDAKGRGDGSVTRDVRPLQPGGSSPVVTDRNNGSLEDRVQPYLQFLQAGNTVRQVRRQMEKDEQPKELIKLMIRLSDDVNAPVSTRASSQQSDATNSAPSKASPEELSALKQDPVIGKYIKMAAMGVPFGNVEQKMKVEGVGEEDVLRAAQALGHAAAPSAAASTSSLSSGGGESRPSSSRRSSSVSLVKMHWNTIPKEKLENSIWANSGDQEGDSMEENEMQELEKLFAASGSGGPGGSQQGQEGGTSSAKPTDPRMQLLVLDARRAQNIVIGLSQFKGQKSHTELLAAVCRLDDLNGNLNVDKLQNLSPLLPTPHEAKKMEPAKASQHPAEVFFNTAITFYPELLKRLQCFVTCLTFADTSAALLTKMKRIVDACNEVISSDSLARILQKMLTVGNLMNEGTYRGQASGFTLDSLLKMVHTKGVDKKTSVLDYVIKSLLDRSEDRLLALPDTLEVDDEATRLSGRDCSREIEHLLSDFRTLEEEHQKASKGQIESAAVQEFTKDFTGKLQDFLEYATESIKEVTKMHELMKRKIVVVVEYFGEDAATCETTKIFSVIRQFILAFESSKKALIARRNRKQRK